MSFSIFTNWAVGLINGYKQTDGGLSNNIKYGTIGITTSVAMIKTLANFDAPNIIRSGTTPGQKLAGLFIGVPLLMGMNFCVGHHMGKAIHWAEDDSNSGKGGVRIKLL